MELCPLPLSSQKRPLQPCKVYASGGFLFMNWTVTGNFFTLKRLAELAVGESVVDARLRVMKGFTRQVDIQKEGLLKHEGRLCSLLETTAASLFYLKFYIF